MDREIGGSTEGRSCSRAPPGGVKKNVKFKKSVGECNKGESERM